MATYSASVTSPRKAGHTKTAFSHKSAHGVLRGGTTTVSGGFSLADRCRPTAWCARVATLPVRRRVDGLLCNAGARAVAAVLWLWRLLLLNGNGAEASSGLVGGGDDDNDVNQLFSPEELLLLLYLLLLLWLDCCHAKNSWY